MEKFLDMDIHEGMEIRFGDVLPNEQTEIIMRPTCAHCGKQFMAKENKGLYGISWFADKVGLTQSHIYLCPYCFGDLDGRKTKVEDSFFKECIK